MNNNDQKRWTRAGVAFSVFWVVLLTLAILSPPLQANPGAANTDVEPDVLLVMPNNSADKDEVAGALQEMHGTVLRTFGTGAMTTLVVQTERGKLEEVEKKLAKDTAHFSKLQRNMRAYVQGDPVRLNDPYAASLWHIAALSLQEAWSTNKGNGTFIAIADTGCQGTNADLVGRTCDGLDYVSSSTTKNTGNKDDAPESHGTKMATIAMAAANNVVATNGTSCVAPMIAGLFALGMSRYPSYSNKSLESLMIMSCQKNRERRDKIGYGMPNAEILVSGYCPRGGEEETNNEKPAPPPEGAEFNITPVDPAAIQCDDTPPPAVPSSVDKPTTENQLVAPATR